MSELTIAEKCRLAEVSRAGFYRSRQAADPDEEDLALRDALQQLVEPSVSPRRTDVAPKT